MTKSKSKGAQKRVKVDNLPKLKVLTKKDAKKLSGGVSPEELALLNEIENGTHHVTDGILQRGSK